MLKDFSNVLMDVDGDIGGGGVAPEVPEGDVGGDEPTPETPAGRTYTDEDVQNMIRGRLKDAQAKFEAQYGPYKQTLEKLMDISGMSLEDVQEYIANYEQEQMRQKGIDPDLYKQLQGVKDIGVNAGQVALETRRMIEEEQLKREAMYSDYDQVKEEVREAADRFGITLKEAYWMVNGINRAAAIQKETEQRVMENLRNKRGLGAEGDSSGEIPAGLDLTPEEFRIAKESGIDPAEYAAMKNIQDYGQYLEAKKQKGAK